MVLTRRQKQVLDFLANFINSQGYSPSFEEIAEGLNLSSLATVHKHLQVLERKGFIRRQYNQSRSVEVIAVPGTAPINKVPSHSFDSNSVAAVRDAMQSGASADSGLPQAFMTMEFPLLGQIAAGRPVEAIPQPESFSFGDFASRKGKIYVLRVKGDSMVDDHICNGDYILVESAETAVSGEIVVALIGGTDATLKRFFTEGGEKVRLQPANSQMDPIVLPASDVQIQGRVIGVLRKY